MPRRSRRRHRATVRRPAARATTNRCTTRSAASRGPPRRPRPRPVVRPSSSRRRRSRLVPSRPPRPAGRGSRRPGSSGRHDGRGRCRPRRRRAAPGSRRGQPRWSRGTSGWTNRVRRDGRPWSAGRHPPGRPASGGQARWRTRAMPVDRRGVDEPPAGSPPGVQHRGCDVLLVRPESHRPERESADPIDGCHGPF